MARVYVLENVNVCYLLENVYNRPSGDSTYEYGRAALIQYILRRWRRRWGRTFDIEIVYFVLVNVYVFETATLHT